MVPLKQPLEADEISQNGDDAEEKSVSTERVAEDACE